MLFISSKCYNLFCFGIISIMTILSFVFMQEHEQIFDNKIEINWKIIWKEKPVQKSKKWFKIYWKFKQYDANLLLNLFLLIN